MSLVESSSRRLKAFTSTERVLPEKNEANWNLDDELKKRMQWVLV
jgi:hypothetical protein